MSHANARLTVHGRLLLVQRVASGRPVAHVARELGISRQCAYRWVRRYAAGGLAGLADRSSRPRRMPRRAAPAVEARVVAARRGLRRGPAFVAQATGVPARTVSRVLRPAREPCLAGCDPLTGQGISASKATPLRYERDRPWAPGRNSSALIAPDKTGKQSGSTAPGPSNGPTASPLPATTSAPPPSHPG